MYQQQENLKLTQSYRIGRNLHSSERDPFESLRKLRPVAKKMNARILAHAGMVGIDIVKPSEALMSGMRQPEASKRVAQMKNDHNSLVLNDKLSVQIEPTVHVYEDGKETRLGIPIVLESRERLLEERRSLIDGLFDSDSQREYLDEWEPNLNIAIIGGGDDNGVRAAGILAIVAKDLL